MSIIIPANSAISGGFGVSNSVMFEQSSDPYFQKTPTGDGNQRTFTFSVWLKMDLHDSGDTHKIFDTGSSTNYFTIYFTTEPFLVVKGRVSSSNVLELIPSQGFRDPTAWFHLYVAVDTTQGTAADRCKIYINGSQVTSFGTATYPNQNTDFENQDANYPFRLGADKGLGDEHYDGYMAEYMYVDGAVQAISDFGEFDEDSPTIWKPKDISAINVNPANDNGNGFYLDFKDASNLGNDVGVNAGTDFSENNIVAADQKTDTCTNNFATINPLYYSSRQSALTEGNLTATSSGANWNNFHSTIAPSTGKWYWEVKVENVGSNTHPIGIVGSDDTDLNSTSPGDSFDNGATGISYVQTGDKDVAGSRTSYGNSYTTNDIIGVAMDLDNHKLYFSKNGTFQNSGNPASGATGTGAISIVSGHSYLASFAHYNTMVDSINFGNPAFSISSGNADGNGYGNFEYAVPANYYSLNSKNLAEYG